MSVPRSTTISPRCGTVRAASTSGVVQDIRERHLNCLPKSTEFGLSPSLEYVVSPQIRATQCVGDPTSRASATHTQVPPQCLRGPPDFETHSSRPCDASGAGRPIRTESKSFTKRPGVPSCTGCTWRVALDRMSLMGSSMAGPGLALNARIWAMFCFCGLRCSQPCSDQVWQIN